MDILIDTIKTCLKDLICIIEEMIKETKEAFLLIHDIFYLSWVGKKIFKASKLKPIPIRFCLFYQSYGQKKPVLYKNACFEYDMKTQKPLSVVFGIYFLYESQLWDKIFNHVNYKFKTRKEKLFFILGHEICHYLQYSKYNKIWNYYHDKSKKSLDWLFMNDSIYRKQSLEKYADRFALSLHKRIKNNSSRP